MIKRIIWVVIFGITMGYFEASVVVYLRAIYYPEGFLFPLNKMTDFKIAVEVFREAASIVMLLAVAHLAGRKYWERFAFFMLTFGVWDIFYYIFLKIILGWPDSLFVWDILFLIPLPWIGPVIAPVSISLIMIIAAIIIIRSFEKGIEFRPDRLSYILAFSATALILYSFMYDLDATLRQQLPRPYRFTLLIAGDALFVGAFVAAYYASLKKNRE